MFNIKLYFCHHSRFTPLSSWQGTGSADGDSATEETQRRLREFRAKLEELTEGKRHFTFVMDDPSGNSYLQVSRPAANSDLVRSIVACLGGSQADLYGCISYYIL